MDEQAEAAAVVGAAPDEQAEDDQAEDDQEEEVTPPPDAEEQQLPPLDTITFVSLRGPLLLAHTLDNQWCVHVSAKQIREVDAAATSLLQHVAKWTLNLGPNRHQRWQQTLRHLNQVLPNEVMTGLVVYYRQNLPKETQRKKQSCTQKEAQLKPKLQACSAARMALRVAA